MLNRDFLKRLTFRFARGEGGWMPYYLFYLGDGSSTTGSQIAFSDDRAVEGAGLRNPAQFSAFAKHGQALNASMSDYPVDYGDHLRIARVSNSQANDVTGGVKQSIALQNLYMGYQNDGEGLQYEPRIALSAVALDPEILIDPVASSFNFETVVDMYLDPEVRNGDATPISEAVLRMVRSRMTMGLNGDLEDLKNIIGSDPYTSYTDRAGYSGPRFFVTSSDLDFDPSRPLIRFIGRRVGLEHDYLSSDVDTDLLKVKLFANPIHIPFINPNCVLLAARASMVWYQPVAALIQGGINPVTVISPIYSSNWGRPSFNVRGFVASVDPVTASASTARPKFKHRNVIEIDRSGSVASGSYRVERYACDVIERNLTSHLPMTDDVGKETKYFTDRATYLHNSVDNALTYRMNYSCLQPVAFPAAQEPNDIWLWYVSMDDDYEFWLNKQEIGRANVSQCVSKIPSSPIQMVVANGKVWMLYGSSIRVLTISTGTWNAYRTGVELPSTMLTSIAVDREKHKIWVGHETGLFEFTTSVQPLDVSSLPTVARRVSRQGLQAVNGYLAWNTADFLQHKGGYELIFEHYVVRADTTNGTLFKWTFQDVVAAGLNEENVRIWEQLGRIGLRSNGEVLISHTSREESINRVGLGLSWFKVNADGTLYRKHWCENFSTLNGSASITEPLLRMFSLPMYRIDDFHYATGLVPFLVPGSYGSFNGSDKDESTVILSSNSPYFSHSSQICEFRIDDDTNWLYQHPGHYEFQVDSATGAAEFQYSDIVNYPATKDALVPLESLIVRGPDMEFALFSSCPISYDGAYIMLMCGQQNRSPMGIQLSWNGSSWVHGVAGQRIRSRRLHSDLQPISPYVSVAFDSQGTGHIFNKLKVYRVDVQPGTSASMPNASLYLGDYAVRSENLIVGQDGSAEVSASKLDTFCGVDTEQVKDISCVVSGVPLTLVSSNPGASQFTLSKHGVFGFNISRAGATASVTYNFIQQAV